MPDDLFDEAGVLSPVVAEPVDLLKRGPGVVGLRDEITESNAGGVVGADALNGLPSCRHGLAAHDQVERSLDGLLVLGREGHDSDHQCGQRRQ